MITINYIQSHIVGSASSNFTFGWWTNFPLRSLFFSVSLSLFSSVGHSFSTSTSFRYTSTCGRIWHFNFGLRQRFAARTRCSLSLCLSLSSFHPFDFWRIEYWIPSPPASYMMWPPVLFLFLFFRSFFFLFFSFFIPYISLSQCRIRRSTRMTLRVSNPFTMPALIVDITISFSLRHCFTIYTYNIIHIAEVARIPA